MRLFEVVPVVLRGVCVPVQLSHQTVESRLHVGVLCFAFLVNGLVHLQSKKEIKHVYNSLHFLQAFTRGEVLTDNVQSLKNQYIESGNTNNVKLVYQQ